MSVDEPTIVAVLSAPTAPVLTLVRGIDRASGELVGFMLQRVDVRPGLAWLHACSTAATIAVTVSQLLERHGNDSDALQLQGSKDFGGSAAKLPVPIVFRRPPNPRFDSCAPPLNFTKISVS